MPVTRTRPVKRQIYLSESEDAMLRRISEYRHTDVSTTIRMLVVEEARRLDEKRVGSDQAR